MWHIICLCVSRHRGGHKIWRIITRKRLGRGWKASYWFLKGPDSSPECFISSAFFVLHIKDSIFLWILIAVKTTHPLPAEEGDKSHVNYLETEKGFDPFNGPSSCQIINQREMTDMWGCMKMAQNKERKAETPGPYVLSATELSALTYCMRENRILWHKHTHTHTFKSSVKTWIRIWWAHRERWNASACSVPAKCKQPAHVCAWLSPLKLLSISPRCPFLLIQTFVPPATTDAIPPQDFIHKHSVGIPRLQPAPLWVQLSRASSRKRKWFGP